jgi:hypothetical protein
LVSTDDQGCASLTSLRVFREAAERGTLTAAATVLGYTRSAVSRQLAALERAAGTTRAAVGSTNSQDHRVRQDHQFIVAVEIKLPR